MYDLVSSTAEAWHFSAIYEELSAFRDLPDFGGRLRRSDRRAGPKSPVTVLSVDRFCHLDTINGSRHDAAGIPRTLSCRVQALKGRALEGLVSEYAQR